MVILGECCFRHAAVKQAPSSYTRCRTLPVISALPTRYFKHLSVFIGEFTQCLISPAHLGQTATLHQTVRCPWLLARLIQRPDFALLSASSVHTKRCEPRNALVQALVSISFFAGSAVPNDVNLAMLSFKHWFRFPLCQAPRCPMMQTWQYSRLSTGFGFFLPAPRWLMMQTWQYSRLSTGFGFFLPAPRY
jgi:hypothetical protein